jgi:hypothetical protein
MLNTCNSFSLKVKLFCYALISFPLFITLFLCQHSLCELLMDEKVFMIPTEDHVELPMKVPTIFVAVSLVL